MFSTLTNSNIKACLIVCLLPLFLLFKISGKKHFLSICILAFCYCLYLKAYVGVFTVLLLVVWQLNNIKWRNLLVLCLFVLAIIFCFNSNSIYGRYVIWKIVFKEHVFTINGCGYNSFVNVYGNLKVQYFTKYSNPTQIAIVDESPYCYNEFLELVFDFGYMGLIILILLIVLFIIKVRQLPLHKLAKILPLLYSIFIICLFANIHFVLHNIYILIIFCGLLCTVGLFILFVNGFKKTSFVCGLLFSGLSIVSLIKYFKSEQNKKAIFYAINTCQIEANYLASSMVQNNGKLTFALSGCYFENNEMQNAIICLNNYTTNFYDYNVLIRLGDYYALNYNYQAALQYYKKATLVLPNRFLPLFKLFQTYTLINDTVNKKNISELILNKAIKIPSTEIDYYKNYVLTN